MRKKNGFLCRTKTSFVRREGRKNRSVEIDRHESNEGGFIMKIVPMDDVLNGMDRLLSALDLLEMNVTLRVNHAVKHKEDEVMDDIEVVNMHLTHLDSKLEHHLEKGSWLHRLETLAAV